ncbi:MAG TPA: YebC/PmpR family DNA-binding transcriptional regulator [Patescibacteria group bacterium]|nr:YebC/PmpR family DNA-binding transcriptional regulator [Patescibacteria group bacterium]
MSGHSKWSTIKRAKGAADAKRGLTFTKVGNAITIAAKLGNSGDPEANPRLRMALEEARSVNMPKENIQRAIDRGLGNLPGQTLEEVVYEGFGPAKTAFLVEVVTDNKLRTLQEMKNLFDRTGGALGGSGSTAYMFKKVGEIKVFSKGGNSETEILEIIDGGAEDVEEINEEGSLKYLVYTDPTGYSQVLTYLKDHNFKIGFSGIIMKPVMLAEITGKEEAERILAFTEKLEDHDDVQKVYANFDIPEELMTE